MKQEWINLSTPQGVLLDSPNVVDCIHHILFEEYLSILENILARVRHPFRYSVGVRQDGCRLLEVNTTASDSSGVKHDRFINESDAVVLPSGSLHPSWRSPTGSLHARKGCVRLYSLFQTVERTNVTFFIFY